MKQSNHVFKKSAKKLIGLFISFVLIFTLGATSSIAQQKFNIAGKMTLANTIKDTINVGDTEGHIISLSEFEGFNVSTGKEKFMDGALVFGMGFADLVMGNGPYQDYAKVSLNGDVVFYKGQAKVATTLSPEGKPVTTYEGTLSFTKGEYFIKK
ncbi:MAG: hypothetical protein GH151_08030 [Bacteroidetes bacterium]|nr:hypothetical protein [Bacteroidota bacterium]